MFGYKEQRGCVCMRMVAIIRIRLLSECSLTGYSLRIINLAWTHFYIIFTNILRGEGSVVQESI